MRPLPGIHLLEGWSGLVPFAATTLHLCWLIYIVFYCLKFVVPLLARY